MEDNEISEQTVLFAGDLVNAMSDLECLWAYHGLPGVPKERYGLWPQWLVKTVQTVARNQEKESLIQALRILIDELYRRFSNPEYGDNGDEQGIV